MPNQDIEKNRGEDLLKELSEGNQLLTAANLWYSSSENYLFRNYILLTTTKTTDFLHVIVRSSIWLT